MSAPVCDRCGGQWHSAAHVCNSSPGFRIKYLWAWTCIGDNDEEGICGYMDERTRTWMPLVASDGLRLNAIRPLAEQIAKRLGKPLKLSRFAVRSDVETVNP